MKRNLIACLLAIMVVQLAAPAASGPRVSFRCAQDHAAKSLTLTVRNEGPDRLAAGTTVYYFYRTPASDMSIVGSLVLDSQLDKGGTLTINAGGNAETRITECGCSLRRLVPTARTSERKSQ